MNIFERNFITNIKAAKEKHFLRDIKKVKMRREKKRLFFFHLL